MKLLKRIAIGLLAATLFQCFFALLPDSARAQDASAGFCRPDRLAAYGESGDQGSNIRWFKDHMGISPKYQERRLGIAGMSWLQFFTMAFLALFSIGSLVAYYSWKRKTRRILLSLLEEGKDAKKRG